MRWYTCQPSTIDLESPGVVISLQNYYWGGGEPGDFNRAFRTFRRYIMLRGIKSSGIASIELATLSRGWVKFLSRVAKENCVERKYFKLEGKDNCVV